MGAVSALAVAAGRGTALLLMVAALQKIITAPVNGQGKPATGNLRDALSKTRIVWLRRRRTRSGTIGSQGCRGDLIGPVD
jgi:hypothetical protein